MIITLAWIPMVWALVPETVRKTSTNLPDDADFNGKAGRSLEQMDYFFKKYQDKWYIRDVAYEWVERDQVMQEDVKEWPIEVENADKGASSTVDVNGTRVEA